MAPPERIVIDIMNIEKRRPEGIILGDVSEDMSNFSAYISGPPDTAYRTGLFAVNIRVPQSYPFKPPKVRFETKVFHPNICDVAGGVCVDILKSEWTAATTLEDALKVLQGLFQNPNSESPLNGLAASMWESSRDMFDKTVTTWTHHFAGGTNKVQEYEDKIKLVCEVKGFKEPKRAITVLTRNYWNLSRVLP